MNPSKLNMTLCLEIALGASLCRGEYTPTPDKNVLFIAVDDLRPQIRSYGQNLNGVTNMITPNLDALIRDGVAFTRSYCNYPVCGASRCSVLTGTRPFKTPGKDIGRFWFWNDSIHLARNQTTGPTLPGYFKSKGYVTASFGKVYNEPDDDTANWDSLWRDNLPKGTLSVLVGAMTEDQYPDYQTASKAIAEIEAHKNGKFFCAAGFKKPHLPFEMPQAYWNMYSNTPIARPYNNFIPIDAPRESVHSSPELRLQYTDIPDTGPLTNEQQCIDLIRGYYACVTFMDAQLGRVIEKLKNTRDGNGVRLYDKTVIVLWGDHGWNLEEHTLWTKHNNYRTALQAPLIIRDPDIPGNKHSSRLVEFVDIYPTLCELAGVGWPDANHLEGSSLVPLMQEPDRPWKQAIFARHVLADTVITERYQYTEYITSNDTQKACMLYDESIDPDENRNIAPQNPKLVAELSALLGGGTPEGKRTAWRSVVDVNQHNSPINRPLPLSNVIHPIGNYPVKGAPLTNRSPVETPSHPASPAGSP